MPISTDTPSAPDRYSRLLPPGAALPPEESEEARVYVGVLRDLANRMDCDDGSLLSGQTPPRPQNPPFSGFTYFGQFVDHDLTSDGTELTETWGREPGTMVNRHAPRLDLDHIYGRGPHDPLHQALYEADGVRLKVGSSGRAGHPFDVPVARDETRGGLQPLVADERSRENVIIRQIVALWSRMHNFAVKQFQGIASPEARFARARLHTIWTFQWLVRGDFLGKVLDWPVYDWHFNQKQTPRFEWPTFSIPVEFSLAAMRFGHSMVRPNYALSDTVDRLLREIFERSNTPGALESDPWEIAWGRFFQGAGTAKNALPSQPIDTRLTSALFHLPPDTRRLFNPRGQMKSLIEDSPVLALRTLIRGAGLRLASGQVAAAAFGLTPLSEELTRDDANKPTVQGDFLKNEARARLGDDRMLTATPLWYYILKESELHNVGSRLGPTGSHLVAETIRAALRHDSESIERHPDADGQPPEWLLSTGAVRFTTLRALFSASHAF